MGLQLLDTICVVAVLPPGRSQKPARNHRRLAAAEGKLRHLGITSAPKRSTLAYANEHRDWRIYQDLFHALASHFRAQNN